VRWRLFQTAAKIVRYGRQVFLKISAAMLDAFTASRECCARVMREGGVIPEMSCPPGRGIFALLGGRRRRAADCGAAPKTFENANARRCEIVICVSGRLRRRP
jgi:hypothetical protein